MTDPPRSIATLIDALSGAQKRASEASSANQRKARHNAVLRAALALYERLGELRAWLDANEAAPGDDAAFLAWSNNMTKYVAGWDALNAAERIIPQWKQDHGWEEIDDADVGPGVGGGVSRAPQAQNPQGKAVGRAKAGQPPRADGGGAAARDADGLRQPALL